jgi:hypothetical protein
MPGTREIRCEKCRALNRVRAYSFRQIPSCGSCHKPLPESAAIKALRDIYSWRKPLGFLVVLVVPLAFCAWFSSSAVGTKVPTATPSTTLAVDSCAARPQPREGIYKWYGAFWGPDTAELTIKTSVGSNYFIKLDDLTGRAARAYFVRGGFSETFPVPLGTFALKYATGKFMVQRERIFWR